MLKTTELSEKFAPKLSKADNNDVFGGVKGRTNETVKNSPLSKTCVPNI